MDAALITYLLDQQTITAEVEDRIYPDIAPQKAERPHLVVRLDDGVGEGHAGGHAGLTTNDYSIYCEGSQVGGYAEAKDLAEIVRLTLDGYQGLMDDVDVRRVEAVVRASTRGTPRQGDEVGLPSVVVDAEISFRSTIPTFQGS